ncbi:ATP-dependent RNA helicase DHX33 [Lamellibrachia satsuma]|nr:ATP-dependent RNA helicase DHX33 [Lamellibrachia satsuma]
MLPNATPKTGNCSLNGKRPFHSSSPQSNKKQKLMNGSPHNYVQLQEDRRELPIYSARKKLLQQVQRLSSVIVIGETGSGKTTQIPQYLYEAQMHRNHLIACTQPRRVAAMTVAERVASEKGTDVGELVGYCVRFDDMTNENTRIKYMTDGMLLREAILDPILKRYAIVILDEAHERTVHTDVLFGVVKAAQKYRKNRGLMPLKIIVMSATMDVDHFSQYFGDAPVLYIEGRQYPVKVLYAVEPQSDYLFAALVTVFQIHKEAPANEDILVFLTGQEEIESAVKSIKDIAQDLSQDCPPLVVCPMYAALPAYQQMKVFQPTPKGSRKVIVSTNIAETSVTIHDIKHVIDTGMVKAKSYNAASGLDLLRVQRVSQAQAWQRTGRAGREAPGTCYRLYTEPEFDKLNINALPEIQRCNLASVVLQLLALGISDVLSFDFMDKPSKDSLEGALQQLEWLGAVAKGDNVTQGKLKLTPLGKLMAAFPLDPKLAKTLLAAKDHNCLDEMLTIVSLLSVESILHTPQNKREEATAVRRKFVSPDGDHLTMLNIYRAYKGFNGSKQWCFENYINGRNLKMAADVRKQLHEISCRLQLPSNSCGRDTTPIRKCLTAGLFMNSAELQKEGKYATLITRKAVAIHPSSSLFMCKPACVIYTNLVQTTKCYMRDVCVIDPDWLNDAAPRCFKKKKMSM